MILSSIFNASHDNIVMFLGWLAYVVSYVILLYIIKRVMGIPAKSMSIGNASLAALAAVYLGFKNIGGTLAILLKAPSPDPVLTIASIAFIHFSVAALAAGFLCSAKIKKSLTIAGIYTPIAVVMTFAIIYLQTGPMFGDVVARLL